MQSLLSETYKLIVHLYDPVDEESSRAVADDEVLRLNMELVGHTWSSEVDLFVREILLVDEHLNYGQLVLLGLEAMVGLAVGIIPLIHLLIPFSQLERNIISRSFQSCAYFLGG
jgi:hypothetical protein